MELGIGVDTGDTFTDAVLLDLEVEDIIDTKKVRTTHSQLSSGIFEAIDEIVSDGFDPGDVVQVSVSTTLATNAIVEDRGRQIGLLMIGWRPKEGWELPSDTEAHVSGRFSPQGDVVESLDLESAESAISRILERVEGLAISGYFGVRNPEHEKRVKQIAQSKTDKPVICGHELTGKLGFYERAVTAVLNAKVIPIIADFLDEMESSLHKRGIEAPLMVMKSDGYLTRAKKVKEKPVETIFSGPAASAMGAKNLSNNENAIIVDIGGTTTDIALVNAGTPVISSKGASVGEWQTKVEAMDIRSVGLGGDSEISLERHDGISIGPRSITPLAFGDLDSGDYEDMRVHGMTDFYKKTKRAVNTDRYLTESKLNLLRMIPQRPTHLKRLQEAGNEKDIWVSKRYLEDLENRGFLEHVSFTPTDSLHMLEEYREGDVQASEIGATILGKRSGLSPEDFSKRTKRTMEKRVATEIVKKLILEEMGEYDFENKPLWRYLIREDKAYMDVEFSLDYPIVGIGAPVDSFLPQVAERLGTDYISVDYAEVGNAVGAVTSGVIGKVEMIVSRDSEENNFIFITPAEREVSQINDPREAMRYGREKAKRMTVEKVENAGGEDIEIEVQDERYTENRGEIVVIGIGSPIRG